MILARGLCKQFGRMRVLQSLDVAIARGQVTAVVGPNGAGKTTFIKCLLGLTRPDAGTLLFDNAPVLGADNYRSRIGYMPQIARFPENLTGDEFLQLLRTLRGASEADDTLIDEFKLRPHLCQQLRTLSGGTKQKVNAAAAFMFSPEVLILDEPTSGLDPVAAGIMKARIRAQRAAGRTVILTSHVLSEIDELADNIVYLADGRVQFSGTVAEIYEVTNQPTLERAVAALMTGSEA